jgi:hypothetical protein
MKIQLSRLDVLLLEGFGMRGLASELFSWWATTHATRYRL